MHDQFLHWFDKQSNNSAPEVTPEEIDKDAKSLKLLRLTHLEPQ